MPPKDKFDTPDDVIGFYGREFECFNNFAAYAVEWRERVWMTSEHAYQAAKFFATDPELIEQIAAARSPHDAKKIARAHNDRRAPDWDERKVAMMEEICRAKLAQHPHIQDKLRATGDKTIVEDSPKDDFWGWGPNKDGRNELGQVWMRLRTESQ